MLFDARAILGSPHLRKRIEEETMDPTAQLDAAGRRRSPATLPGYHSGRAPRNKGRRYPADPPRVEEIIAVMRLSLMEAEAEAYWDSKNE
jgi:hypothetical protein